MLSHPLPLLLLFTALSTFLIQSGELGTADTMHRVQVSHSFWTGQPQVFPNEYPEFGVHGRGGALYAWYGIGQSLLMLPADLAGSAASYLPPWRNYVSSEADPTIRNIVISFSINILISVLTAFVAFRFLGMLGFSIGESIAGTLGLLCATTHLHYAQNMTENNYIFLLTLAGIALQYQWLIGKNRHGLLLGSAALGLNLLTRITTIFDIFAAACFLFLVAFITRHARTGAKMRLTPAQNNPAMAGELSYPLTIFAYLRTALPVYVVFLFIDRAYQYIRFGSWTNTYMTVLGREQRLLDPTLPASFPFNGHWFQGGLSSGILGPLFSPEKSLFLFDPMFLLVLLLIALLWKRLAPAMQAFFVATLILLAVYIGFYANYIGWSGDFAWGDRYISSAGELSTLLTLPLLLRYRQTLGRLICSFAFVVTAGSVIVQCASLAFWVPLEIYQMQDFGHHTCVVLLRFKNIAAFALHSRSIWGLNTPAMFQDPWDAVHITAWNFLPSLLRHVGMAPLWTVHVLYGVWIVVALALAFITAKLFRIICHSAAKDAHYSMNRKPLSECPPH